MQLIGSTLLVFFPTTYGYQFLTELAETKPLVIKGWQKGPLFLEQLTLDYTKVVTAVECSVNYYCLLWYYILWKGSTGLPMYARVWVEEMRAGEMQLQEIRKRTAVTAYSKYSGQCM